MPGQYYIYIPFVTSDVTQLLDSARGWIENRLIFQNDRRDRKTPGLIRHGVNRISEKIHESPGEYTLYILAHCNKTSISNTNNVFLDKRETLSPGALATRLVADGLPKDIVNLKMFACNSGVAPDGKSHSFGELLYYALVTRGYENFRLSAYRTPLKAETVDSATGHKRTQTGARPSTVRSQWPRRY